MLSAVGTAPAVGGPISRRGILELGGGRGGGEGGEGEGRGGGGIRLRAGRELIGEALHGELAPITSRPAARLVNTNVP